MIWIYWYYMHIKNYPTHLKNIKAKEISYERPKNSIEDH